MTSLCESVVRERPEQWFWMYKRWRYIPRGRSGDGYPFYAETLPVPFEKSAGKADA